ncbi:ankyrin repeat-containing protein BDA1-like [Magnolia sinica]|uniref:ankyrin repeat-containing protein BDA1-like n=1 Tax=Magnolia sinica TaxID=86752 RepID=UPI00265A5A68|nr:ankyrin repeat-containing protein BDA1-like [Magnolia sinica]
MEFSRLYQAAERGDVNSLHELHVQDPAILDRVMAAYVPETPLHTAALLGHISFAQELLSRKPELVRVRNWQGFSPLHLASAKGDVDMVKQLLPLVDISHDQDHEGRTPLHAAAMKGQVEVLSELVGKNPNSVWDLTVRQETVLHLCVKHDQFDALQMLVGLVGVDADHFTNFGDGDGNTILHLSTAKKHLVMMRFLNNKTNVDVNATNHNGLTALDVLALCPREPGDMEIADILRGNGGKRAREVSTPQEIIVLPHNQIPEGSTRSSPPSLPQQHKPQIPDTPSVKSVGKIQTVILLAATLIATVSFEAALTPPGGLWQEDLIVYSNDSLYRKNHTAGTSIPADKEPRKFNTFQSCNIVAFVLSLMLILLSILPEKFRSHRKMICIMVNVFFIAVLSMACAFYCCIKVYMPNGFKLDFEDMLSWLLFLGFYIVLLIVNLLYPVWFLVLPVMQWIKRQLKLFEWTTTSQS